jgi:hypothetical protein
MLLGSNKRNCSWLAATEGIPFPLLSEVLPGGPAERPILRRHHSSIADSLLEVCPGLATELALEEFAVFGRQPEH